MMRAKAGAVRRVIDPRLVIGLALVLASVGGVVALVSAADETVAVLAAGEPLAPGDVVERGDLVTVDVRLAGATERYLVPDDVPAEGVVLTRPVGEGELVPVDAVGSASGLRVASLVLDVAGTLAASVRPGALVDVWASREEEGGRFGPPAVIVSGATVVRLVESDSIVSGGGSTAVEVLVPKPRIARVLEAAANSDAVSIVPAGVPVR